MRGRIAAVAISVLAHAGVAAAFVIGLPQRDPPGAVDKGLQGIEVLLAAGGTTGAQAAEPPPEPVKPEIVAKPVEPPPEPEPEIVTSKDTAPDLAETPKPEPRPEPKPKPRPVAEKPKPQPPAPKQIEKTAEAPARDVKVAAVAAPVPQGQVGQQAAPGAGNGSARTSGGNPGAAADYYALLSAWLESKKDYPWRAQHRHNEGTAYLQFVVARNGKVLSYRIKRSSGHPLLDEAVERMIQKADPLPPIPPDLDKDHLEIIVPVQFYLKNRS
jgi:protein TonB